MENTISATAFTDTKPHYELLDGLRGIAALLVVWYHVFEGFAFAAGSDTISGMNHGYLAVDFFFILSGFVISYAYDDRWKKGFTLKDFFRRRLIRLHPMVIMGAVIGAVTFCIQGSVQWDGTHIATSAVMLALLCAMFMIPAVPGCRYEVRGNGEMFPLNGPSWSLFFEYIGNIIYALAVRRMSDKALKILVVILGALLLWFTAFDISGYGNFGLGWTLDTVNFCGGLIRMLFPFSMGMILARNFGEGRFKKIHVNNAFTICSVILACVLFVPAIKAVIPCGAMHICVNGLFEAAAIMAVFPAVVLLGASGFTTGKTSTALCKFLGDISFPLYIVHYPFMYLFYSWLIRTQQFTLARTWPAAIGVFAWNILVAWLCLKFYDIPVRRFLSKFPNR